MDSDNSPLQPQPLETVMAEHAADIEKSKIEEQEVTKVVATPAWNEVVEMLRAKSSPDVIIERLKGVVYDGKTTNEQLGELTRVAIMSAEDLKSTVDLVIETVNAHEAKRG